MRINGNDLILLGLCFGLAGALILAKGYIFQDMGAIRDEAASYYGANPFAVRNKITQRYEGISGALLMLPAVLLQVIGVFLNLRGHQPEPIFASSVANLLFLALFSVVLIWGTNIASGAFARARYIPELRLLQKEAMEQAEVVLDRDGLYQNEVGKELNVPRDTRDTRLTQMKQRLEVWQRLFQFPRARLESDTEYLGRLRSYLDRY